MQCAEIRELKRGIILYFASKDYYGRPHRMILRAIRANKWGYSNYSYVGDYEECRKRTIHFRNYYGSIYTDYMEAFMHAHLMI